MVTYLQCRGGIHLRLLTNLKRNSTQSLRLNSVR